MNVKEKEYLRELAREYKALCDLEENQAKRRAWYRTNDLVKGQKPVFINHYWPMAIDELFPKDEYVCEDDTARNYEGYFKIRMFYAQVLKDDNVLEPVVYSKLFYKLDQYGGINAEITYSADDHAAAGAYEIIPVILEEEDKDLIKDPILTYDKERSRAEFEKVTELFGDILTVIKEPTSVGMKLADEYSWLRGIEQTYMDMYDDPEWMHEVLGKLGENIQKRLTMTEEVGIWGTLDLSFPLGSSGLRYITGVPDFREIEGDIFEYKVKLKDSWGSSIAEVFNCVSSEMHKEFGYDYSKYYTDLLGNVTVGCCEVLDKKVGLIKDITNARKYSVSEWCNPELAASEIKDKYVFSYRAAGVPFVPDEWDKDEVEKEIRSVLEAVKKHECNAEIILNIGGTLGANPRQKVTEWSKLVRDLINEYYPE
ncbi:MAG: hypothetical protein R3Y47_08630 [Lachnospiraceae bacterium]